MAKRKWISLEKAIEGVDIDASLGWAFSTLRSLCGEEGVIWKNGGRRPELCRYARDLPKDFGVVKIRREDAERLRKVLNRGT